MSLSDGHKGFSLFVWIIFYQYCQGEVLEQRISPGDDWWRNTVFYQIYPRSFMDSDGDGIGDLNGITSKLHHLASTGISSTWISPIYKSPMYDFGYDISDFYDIQPEYGTMEDFDELLDEAKELGIKIIMDFVPNHASTEGEWFQQSLNAKSPYADWFVWEDPIIVNGQRRPPNNWLSVFRKSAWEYRKERGQYYLHQFAIQQADLNFRNPSVVEEMKNVIRFWLKKGIAGFRIDAINFLFEANKNDFKGKYPDEPVSGLAGNTPEDYEYLDHVYTKNINESHWMVYEWRQIFNEFTKTDNITRLMMTEAYTDIKGTMNYYGNATSEGAHIPFNFGLVTEMDRSSSARDVKYLIDRWLAYMPYGETPNWVIGNHDNSRIGSRYGVERIDGFNMLVLLLPGIAVTYNGEEIGMVDTEISWEDTVDPQACNTDDSVNYWKKSRDPVRSPFQWSYERNAGFSSAKKTWLPINRNYVTLNLESQKSSERSHYKIYKNCINLRALPTFRYGKYESIAFNDDIFAFVRNLHGHDSYVIINNIGNKHHQVDLTHFDGLNSKLVVVETNMGSKITKEDIIDASALALEPYGSLVLLSSGAKKNYPSVLVLCVFYLRKLFHQ